MTKEPVKTEECDFFQLNKYKLDEEWANQPRLMHQYAVQLADARMEMERTKAERDLIKAEIDREIRQHPERFDITKTTEPLVEAVIVRQERYQRITDAVIKAKHKVDVVQAAVTALEHRKAALEGEVKLLAMDYYAEPRAPREADDLVSPTAAFRRKP